MLLMKRAGVVLSVVGALLLGVVMVFGIALAVFNEGDVPEAAAVVMGVLVGIAA